MHVFLGIMLGLLVPYFIRVIIGPSVWDRLLGLNLIASKIIMIIILYATITGMTFLLDFAIIYGLSGFIGTIFIALFLSKSRIRERGEDGGGETDNEDDGDGTHTQEVENVEVP